MTASNNSQLSGDGGTVPCRRSRAPIVFGMNTMFAVRQFLREPIQTARTRGLQPVILAPADPSGGEFAESVGAELRTVPVQREMAPLLDLYCLFRIWLILVRMRPRITNMSTPKMAFLGGIAGWAARVPRRIYTLRGLRYETTRSWKRHLLVWCERVACACAHQVLCISRSVRDAALRDRLCQPEKIAMLGERGSEGITIDSSASEACSARLRSELEIAPGTTVIGFVGRLTRDKGIGELVASFRRLQSEGRQLVLLLLGAFEPGDPIDNCTIQFIRTDPNVKWLGYVPDAARYYHAMDLFVFPTYREGLPKVLLEAAGAAKPVVSTRTTGVVDVVQDGISGILVPPGDVEELTRATAALLDDPARARRMGLCGRALIQEHFDNTVILERLGTMLERLSGREPAVVGTSPLPAAAVQRRL